MDELTFTDLAVLGQIDETTVLERFGPKINSSIFDAGNIVGTLKQKGYVEITPQFPGPTQITVTEKGRSVLALAKEKGAQELDKLDEMMLSLIANGYKDPKSVTEKTNLRAMDVAFHLQKLVMQDYAGAVFKNGRVELNITDAGFKRAGYPPIGAEEDRKKESDEAESIIGEKPVLAPPAEGSPAEEAKPFKLDRQAKLRAKAPYYVLRAVKYAAIGIALVVLAAALYYFLYLRK